MELFERIRKISRCGLAEENISIGVGFEASKVYTIPSITHSLCLTVVIFQDVSSQLLSQWHIHLPASMIPTVMVMDSNSIEP